MSLWSEQTLHLIYQLWQLEHNLRDHTSQFYPTFRGPIVTSFDQFSLEAQYQTIIQRILCPFTLRAVSCATLVKHLNWVDAEYRKLSGCAKLPLFIQVAASASSAASAESASTAGGAVSANADSSLSTNGSN